MKKLFLSLLLFFAITTAAWAANPVILYSDLLVGLKTSTNTSNGNGAYVTIWGANFGSIQGSVTVGGGAVAQILTWTATEICFQLGPSSATGNIVITTSLGPSASSANSPEPFSFTITTNGHIYFVQPGASSNGSGSFSSPYNHIYYPLVSSVPGDTVYILAGTIQNEINGQNGYHAIYGDENQDGWPIGNASNPISLIAYPNATVNLIATGATSTWTNGSSGGSDGVSFVIRDMQYSVISKFNMQDSGGNAAIGGYLLNSRIIGNKIQASNQTYGTVDLTANNWFLLGNEFTGNTASSQNNEAHSVYIDGTNQTFDVGWNYFHNNYGQGWEIDSYHNGPRIGKIHDNLLVNDNSSQIGEKGILGDGCYESGDTGSSLYTNTMYIFNNVIVNEGQFENGGAMQINCGTNYIYNNTIYGWGTETEGAIQFEGGGIGVGGGLPVDYVADNIIDLPSSTELYMSDGNGASPFSGQTFSLVSNNNFFGSSAAAPTQDTHKITSNPNLVSPTLTTSGNWQLSGSSPDINAGYNTNSIVPYDHNGITRTSTPSIGAYEYSACTTNGGACSSSGSCCSGLCFNSMCLVPSGSASNMSLYNMSLGH